MSSLIRAPLPHRLVLHAANVLRATETHTWGRDAATIRWLSPKGRATRLTVAHFKDGQPTYSDALSRLGDILEPMLLMLPTDLAAALRRELDSCEGLRVGGRRSRTAPYWPSPTGTSMTSASGALLWQDVRQKTLGKDYRRRVRARLLELRDPLRQRWDDLWLGRLGPWSQASHLPHTCQVCGECDTVSSAARIGANRCARCSQVAACPWPEPAAGPGRRTEEEALHWHIGDAQTFLHGHTGPSGAALLWIHVHLRDSTSVAHLSHVFPP